eukprot:g48490.t1
MFCADFVLAFVAHFSLCSIFSGRARKLLDDATSAKKYTLPSERMPQDLGVELIALQSPVFSFGSGAFAGLVAALGLYPFDFVRKGAVGSARSHFAYSTIPFMSCYLGLYYWQRPKHGAFAEKVGWAAASTVLASAAELPLDHAKHNIAGNAKMAAFTSVMRVPLATMLLLAYDEILKL